jgi:hypothetical protein
MRKQLRIRKSIANVLLSQYPSSLAAILEEGRDSH